MKLISIISAVANAECLRADCSQNSRHRKTFPNLGSKPPLGFPRGVSMPVLDETIGAEVVSWFDIPYAQPPVGDLRWRAPRELVAPEQLIVERERYGLCATGKSLCGC